MVAVAAIGGAVISGVMSSRAASTQAAGAEAAAQTSLTASREATAETRRQYDLARADTGPYRVAGYAALNRLSQMFLGGDALGGGIPGAADAGAPAGAAPTSGGGFNFLAQAIAQGADVPAGAAPAGAAQQPGAFAEVPQITVGEDGGERIPASLEKLYNQGVRIEFLGSEGDAGRSGRGPTVSRYSIGGNEFEIRSEYPLGERVFMAGAGAPAADAGGGAGTTDALTALLGAGGGDGASPDYSDFFKSPGYQFRLDEGIRARDRSAAARGQLRGGGYARELERYGQGFASGEFNTYADRIAALAGMGQGTTTALGTLGAQSASTGATALLRGASQAGQQQFNAGTARASGYVGAGNAINAGIQNYLTYQQLQNQPQSYPLV